MDIQTEGHAVFRLREVLEEKEYYEALVEYLPDEPSDTNAPREARLREAFEKSHALLFGRSWNEGEPGDAATLAYRMVARLPMELQRRQEMLEMRKESDRREFLLGWLTTFVPKLAARERARGRAGGNGHGLN
jgi:Lon protease-like protein